MSSRILIVDDDLLLLEGLADTLRLRIGEITVETCDSALAALARIADVDYDAIVSDIKMPEMDGLTLMEKVLAIRPATPTLLITGHGDRDLGAKALSVGAYAFIQKPIDRDYFVAWLKRGIHERRLSREVEQKSRELERHAEKLERIVQERTVQLRTNEEHLRQALVAARMVAWEWDPVKDEVAQSETAAAVFGLPPGGRIRTAEEGFSLIHPEDLSQHRKIINDSIATGGNYVSQFRFIRPDNGQVIWLDDRGRAVTDESGKVVRLYGIVQDITERMQTEERLRDSEERFHAIFNQVHVGIAQCDLTGRFVLINQQYCDILARPIQDVLSLRIQDVTHPDDLPRNLVLFERLAAGGPGFEIEKRYVRPDGLPVWVHNTVSVIGSREGQPQYIIAVVHEISERQQSERRP